MVESGKSSLDCFLYHSDQKAIVRLYVKFEIIQLKDDHKEKRNKE
jgi:hypothetical protein